MAEEYSFEHAEGFEQGELAAQVTAGQVRGALRRDLRRGDRGRRHHAGGARAPAQGGRRPGPRSRPPPEPRGGAAGRLRGPPPRPRPRGRQTTTSRRSRSSSARRPPRTRASPPSRSASASSRPRWRTSRRSSPWRARRWLSRSTSPTWPGARAAEEVEESADELARRLRTDPRDVERATRPLPDLRPIGGGRPPVAHGAGARLPRRGGRGGARDLRAPPPRRGSSSRRARCRRRAGSSSSTPTRSSSRARSSRSSCPRSCSAASRRCAARRRCPSSIRRASRTPRCRPSRRCAASPGRARSWGSARRRSTPTPSIDGTVEMVPGVPPATRLGRPALSGRSPFELAFVAGRHLSYFRRGALRAPPRPHDPRSRGPLPRGAQHRQRRHPALVGGEAPRRTDRARDRARPRAAGDRPPARAVPPLPRGGWAHQPAALGDRGRPDRRARRPLAGQRPRRGALRLRAGGPVHGRMRRWTTSSSSRRAIATPSSASRSASRSPRSRCSRRRRAERRGPPNTAYPYAD